jgi:AAA15 family ATPase/GTPase
MSLFIKEYGGQTTEDGKEGMRFELLSVRGETKIPLKCESEGIKKLISVLSILIAMYNHPSVLVAVDEFDAGVYEYLLGEILGILEENGRGQLIFTSHNLRPLEMIDRKDIIFTTTNPNNRYIRLSSSKGNLRDQYIRSIHVGGQKEELYDYSNPLEIARAFRLAGKEVRADLERM